MKPIKQHKQLAMGEKVGVSSAKAISPKNLAKGGKAGKGRKC